MIDNKLIKGFPILEIKYNIDGSIKPFYILSSEKDIKETQIKSDENELDFRFKNHEIDEAEYKKQKINLEFRLKNQNEIYDDLIFDIIDEKKLEDIKDEIKKANLNNIELDRLASSLSSIVEKKLDAFSKNNRSFTHEDLESWNYKYNRIAKNYEKVREVESFIRCLE